MIILLFSIYNTIQKKLLHLLYVLHCTVILDTIKTQFDAQVNIILLLIITLGNQLLGIYLYKILVD